jgi:hypothetical protein
MANQDKSAARFGCQAAAWVPDMFCNFYFVKSSKIDNRSETTEAIIKRNTYLASLEFKKFNVYF